MSTMTFNEIDALIRALNGAISEARTAEEKLRNAGHNNERRALRGQRREMEDLHDDLVVARTQARGRGAALRAVLRDLQNATIMVKSERIAMQNVADTLARASVIVDIVREALSLVGGALGVPVR